MNWRSNFNEEELERIDGILNFKQQVGYAPGSDCDIIARMIDVLDNAQETINNHSRKVDLDWLREHAPEWIEDLPESELQNGSVSPGGERGEIVCEILEQLAKGTL